MNLINNYSLTYCFPLILLIFSYFHCSLCLIFWESDKVSSDASIKNKHMLRKICLTEKLISYVQAAQWVEIKKLLSTLPLKKSNSTFVQSSLENSRSLPDNMDFYFHPYYIMTIPRKSTTAPCRKKVIPPPAQISKSTPTAHRPSAETQDQLHLNRYPPAITKRIQSMNTKYLDPRLLEILRNQEVRNNKVPFRRLDQDGRGSEAPADVNIYQECQLLYNEINYFTIYKSGNTFIRYLLTKLAKSLSNYLELENTSSKPTEINILAALKYKALIVDRVSQMNNLPLDESNSNTQYFRSKYPALLDSCGQFSFTFVREPIARFISGYTEVEYRLYKDHNFYEPDDSWKALQQGSIERFIEFIHVILRSKGKRNAVLQSSSYNDHIMPQIGTVYHATNLFRSSLHIYKLENFNDDWVRMLNDSQILKCIPDQKVSEYRSGMFSDDNFQPHASSSDPLNTTNVVKAFLANGMKASPSTSHFAQTNSSTLASKPDSSNSTNNNSNNTNLATVYVRILCRLYLVDYICLDYKLPEVCHDLYDEFDDIVDKLKAKRYLRHSV